MGIHAGTTYYDCSEHFAAQLGNILSASRTGQVVLATPFLQWSKQMVYQFCIESKVPTELTWSCEVGPSAPCGRCLSCTDREHLHVRKPE